MSNIKFYVNGKVKYDIDSEKCALCGGHVQYLGCSEEFEKFQCDECGDTFLNEVASIEVI